MFEFTQPPTTESHVTDLYVVREKKNNKLDYFYCMM